MSGDAPNKLPSVLKEVTTSLKDVDEQADAPTIEPSKVAYILEKCGSFGVKNVEVNYGAMEITCDVYPKDEAQILKNKKACTESLSRYFGKTVSISTSEEGKSCLVIRVPINRESLGCVGIKKVLTEYFDRVDEGTGQFLPIIIGEDVDGATEVRKLEELPHLLIGGSTGSGKSSAVHSYIMSMLLANSPFRLQLVMIDMKHVEFGKYASLKDYLATPICNDIGTAYDVLNSLCIEMDKRFELLQTNGYTGISDIEHDGWGCENMVGDVHMPRIVVVIDELADLVVQDKVRAKEGKHTIKDYIQRLSWLQKGRAAGIHLIVATQRPSIDVLPGDTKVNFENRLCFGVSTAVDSRVVLGCSGAEQLRGRGLCMAQNKKRYLAPFVPEQDRGYIITELSHRQGEWSGGDEIYTLPIIKAEDDEEEALSMPEEADIQRLGGRA